MFHVSCVMCNVQCALHTIIMSISGIRFDELFVDSKNLIHSKCNGVLYKLYLHSMFCRLVCRGLDECCMLMRISVISNEQRERMSNIHITQKCQQMRFMEHISTALKRVDFLGYYRQNGKQKKIYPSIESCSAYTFVIDEKKCHFVMCAAQIDSISIQCQFDFYICRQSRQKEKFLDTNEEKSQNFHQLLKVLGRHT